ncbi:uncharacterized protein LOC123373274 isoform X1 [Mauremys mutica]|uniref:uncharacterized protein LOC123373274 isoform X1 n=1 Tax=Mauremys mutica TaxID=74926 RepID=UPI001D168584|nr:uncharacterized protein LOC123373274 isoform X1 [Mauremys mutica]
MNFQIPLLFPFSHACKGSFVLNKLNEWTGWRCSGRHPAPKSPFLSSPWHDPAAPSGTGVWSPEGCCHVNGMSTSGSCPGCPRREPGPLGAARPCSDTQSPSPSLTSQQMGHHVAQLALFVSDPDQDISRQAREGTYRLYQLLLQQSGLTIKEAEDLWCYDWHREAGSWAIRTQPGWGRSLENFISEGQRRYFLQTAMLAIHDPLLHVSQAGLLLTYSLLGEAQQLMGDKLEDVTAKVMGQLRSIQQHQVPEALQGLRLI